MLKVSNKALVKGAVSKRKDPFKGFKWPEPDKERYPGQPCECGGVAKHNGFQGEYWCSKCNSGFWVES